MHVKGQGWLNASVSVAPGGHGLLLTTALPHMLDASAVIASAYAFGAVRRCGCHLSYDEIVATCGSSVKICFFYKRYKESVQYESVNRYEVPEKQMIAPCTCVLRGGARMKPSARCTSPGAVDECLRQGDATPGATVEPLAVGEKEHPHSQRERQNRGCVSVNAYVLCMKPSTHDLNDLNDTYDINDCT